VTGGAIATACALVLATAFGLYWKARNGRVVRQGSASAPSTGAGPDALSWEDLGTPLGARATLVQFSSAFCAPCRATRRILADVSEPLDGVTHVEIDAESRLDLVRRLDVRRTPTTFVLGPDGRVTHRASGQPRKADVIAALGTAL
jgi:thiol-disulfide isomerase/thioredoxin